MLDIALIEPGLTPVARPEVDACGVVRSVAELLRPLAADRTIDLETDCPAGPVTLLTDEDKLAQIVRNLVSNAIKFSEEGGWVRVVTRGDERTVSIAVAESGVGISEEDLPHVFDAFRQPRNGAVGPWGGAGLGLAICRDLTGLLGGEITADSQPGMGSIFTVTLPRATDAAQREAPPSIRH